jgi:hypothetical protein
MFLPGLMMSNDNRRAIGGTSKIEIGRFLARCPANPVGPTVQRKLLPAVLKGTCPKSGVARAMVF